MTSFRGRPSGKHARTWDDRDRRSMLLNIGFGVTIVAALLLLIVAFAASWYDDNLAPAGSVDGQTITKDEYNRQLAINNFRIDYAQRRIRTLLTAGRIRADDAQARLPALDQRNQQAAPIALEQLIDGRIMEQLAPPAGRDRHRRGRRRPARRGGDDARAPPRVDDRGRAHHARRARPSPTGRRSPRRRPRPPRRSPTSRPARRSRRSRRASPRTRPRTRAATSGSSTTTPRSTPPFVEALFAAAEDAPTEVIEGADGVFRVGQVSEIVAPVVDATLAAQVQDEGIKLEDFRDLAPPRRRPAPSCPTRSSRSTSRRARSARSPRSSCSRARASPPRARSRSATSCTRPTATRPPRPRWPTTTRPGPRRRLKARATYDKLKADPSQFDAIARAESDEDAGGHQRRQAAVLLARRRDRRGVRGRDLRARPPARPAPRAGQVRVRLARDPGDARPDRPRVGGQARPTTSTAGRSTFADAARDNSDNAEAAEGGDIGWVGKGQLSAGEGGRDLRGPHRQGQRAARGRRARASYLYLVSDEQTREPDAEQQAALESSAFSIWYSKQKDGFDVTRDPAIAEPTTS